MKPVAGRGAGRPSKLATIAPPRDPADRVRVIAEYHEAAQIYYVYSALYLVMCGFELHAARAEVGHGHWLKWVQDNCPFSHDTASRYLEAAERMSHRVSNYAHVRNFALGRSPLELPPHERRQLIEAVRAATDGATVRQLYLDLGMIRSPQPLGGDHGGGKAWADLTAEERRERIAQRARDEWAVIDRSLNLWCSRERWQHLSNLDLQRAREALQAALTLIPKPEFCGA